VMAPLIRLACRQCGEDAVPIPGSVRPLYCSTTCRTRYRKGRRTETERRREEHVQARLAAAGTDRECAQVRWDALRVLIGRLPMELRAGAWAAVARELQMMTQTINEERRA